MMNNLFDEALRSRIRESDDTPEIRGEFVESLVARFKAIETGKNAEKELEKLKAITDADPGQVRKLAAESVVGRLMQTKKPPAGVTAEGMVAQLETNERFAAAVSATSGSLLRDIRSGALLIRLSPQKTGAAAAPAEKRGSELSEMQSRSRDPGAPTK